MDLIQLVGVPAYGDWHSLGEATFCVPPMLNVFDFLKDHPLCPSIIELQNLSIWLFLVIGSFTLFSGCSRAYKSYNFLSGRLFAILGAFLRQKLLIHTYIITKKNNNFLL